MRACVAAVLTALVCFSSSAGTASAVGVRSRSRARAQTLGDGGDGPSIEEVVRPGLLLGRHPRALTPCGGGACPSLSSPAIVVDASKAPRENVTYTAPLVDTEATPADHQIFSDLVRYRRTIDAIKQHQNDRVEDSVHGLLASARNELYQRDALRTRMDDQKAKAEGQLRTFALLAQEQEKHNRAAEQYVRAAKGNLRKFRDSNSDAPDASLLQDLAKQAGVVERHQAAGDVPVVVSLEKIKKQLEEEQTDSSSNSGGAGGGGDADGE